MSRTFILLVVIGLCLGISCHELYGEPSGNYQYDPYNYGYDVEDNYGNKQWRQEQSSKPMEVHGSYGYRDTNGIYREVTYVADKNGFRANVKTNEPGTSSAKSPASVRLESHHVPSIAHPKPASHGPSYYKSQVLRQVL